MKEAALHGMLGRWTLGVHRSVSLQPRERGELPVYDGIVLGTDRGVLADQWQSSWGGVGLGPEDAIFYRARPTIMIPP
jgi:hypothetical protein